MKAVSSAAGQKDMMAWNSITYADCSSTSNAQNRPFSVWNDRDWVKKGIPSNLRNFRVQ